MHSRKRVLLHAESWKEESWGKKDILRLTGWVFLFFFCFTFCVSCHTGCLKHWGKAGAYPLVPASVVLVLRVTFFVDQGGRRSFSIRVWVGPGVLGFLRQPPSGQTGVQKYIGCRTRPHGGGSGEGGWQAGGWAPLGSAHCWSGAGFQQRRHLCCAHRLSRPKGTPVGAPSGSASATEAQKSAHFTLPASHSSLAARPHSKFTKHVCDALMERHCTFCCALHGS